jgi:hypothetical protein
MDNISPSRRERYDLATASVAFDYLAALVFKALPHAFWHEPKLPESKEADQLMAPFFDRHLGKIRTGCEPCENPTCSRRFAKRNDQHLLVGYVSIQIGALLASGNQSGRCPYAST